MSDYRIKVSIRNNRLLNAMEKKGFKYASQFARAYAIKESNVINLINGAIPPLNCNGEIKPLVKEILDILDINIEQAFTEKQLQGFKKHTFTVEAKESQLLQLINARKPLEMNLIENDVHKLVDNLLSSLPKQYEQAIRMNVFENKTVKEIAVVLGVGTTRVRQIIEKGINKLKTKNNFNKLIETGAIDLFNNTKFKKPDKNPEFFFRKK
jgi:RNA polymerase sigma factor (sigma-70 family)